MKPFRALSAAFTLIAALLALGTGTSSATAAQIDAVSTGVGYTCMTKAGVPTCNGNAPGHAPYLHDFNAINGLTDPVSDFSTGQVHSCAVIAGAAKCWGTNSMGQLGVGPYLPKDTPTQVIGLTSGVTQIDVNGDLSCAIVAGAAKCWGSGSSGKLGGGTWLSDSGLPVDVVGLTSGVTDIAAGAGHACAVVSGAAKCWGFNGSGALGDGSQTGTNSPVQVQGLTSGVTAVAAGNGFSCAIVSGAVKCWGDGGYGQLGNGSTTPTLTPVQVTGITSGATAIAVGTRHACAIVSGVTRCWGEGEQLGNNFFAQSSVPVTVVGVPSDATQLDTSSDHSCAIASGELYCWGDPFSVSYAVTPSVYRGFATHVEFGSETACYIKSGELNCWGEVPGYSGENGQYPVVPQGMESGVAKVAVGGNHLCTIQASGAFCWGANDYGQMGIGVETNEKLDGSYYPVGVPGLDTGVTDISAGPLSTCAVVDAGAACWGDNWFGQIGIGETGTTDGYPHQVNGLDTGVTAVTVGTYFACAIVNGAVKCWGKNDHGQLGDGSTADASSPVQVSGLTSGVTYIKAGEASVCAVQSGAVKCWGTNTDGMLGDGSTTERHAPVSVADTSGATSVSIGKRHSCATVGSALKCWGNNTFGQLGDGKTRSSSSPVAVFSSNPGGTDVSAGQDQTCGVINGSTRCWGLKRRQHWLPGLLKPIAQRTGFEPETNFEATPPSITTDDSADFALSSSDPDATFQCELDRDGNVFENDGTFTVSSLYSGSHSIDCRAIGADGYSDPAGAQYSWAVDKIAPVLFANSETVGTGQLKIMFGTTDSDVASSTCSVDGGAPVACASGFVSPVLAPGPHAITLVLTDYAGNATTRVFSFVVASPPGPPGGPGGTNTAATATFGSAKLTGSTLRVTLDHLQTGDRVSASLTFKRRSGRTTAAKKVFTIGAQPDAALQLKLSAKAMRQLKGKRGGFAGQLMIVVTRAGGSSVTITKSVRLKS